MYSKLMSRLLALLVILFSSMLFVANAVEVPMGAQEVTEGAESTINASNYAAQSIEAYAGNISQLTLRGTGQTKHWQGYYGEVTGTLTLDDAANWTLYDWPVQEPTGEIYATVNTTPDWINVQCFDFATMQAPWEAFYNMTPLDSDGINETFNMTTHPQVVVGEYTILPNTCPSTFTHVNDQFQTEDFVQLLLSDSADRLIFTTIIENKDLGNGTDPVGYNNVAHDFQLLVAEDGTSSPGGVRNTATTTYYFYLDIQ
ncbi:MAG: hypothetical protein HGA85_06725 [Nanoarchaeota archaeon]|nr:hypothetical protein [Nanoarchaeota archaeon]